jgi:hypothetical protein
MKTKEELATEHAYNMIPQARTEVNESTFAEFHLAKSSFIAGYDAASKEVEDLKDKLLHARLTIDSVKEHIAVEPINFDEK